MNYSRNIFFFSNKLSFSTEQLNITFKKKDKGKRAVNIIKNEDIGITELNIRKKSKLFKER
jgi:hypothetical protein